MTIDVIHTGPLGVNTYIVALGGSAVFIVDPAACEFCGDQFVITRYLEEHHFVPVAIVLTHGHFDHVAGLNRMRLCYPSVPIAINKNDAPYIGKNSGIFQQASLSCMNFEEFVPQVSNLPEPTEFLCDDKTLGDTFALGATTQTGEQFAKWKIIHTPGHTPGSVCLYNEEEKIPISGDTVFFESYGRTDLPGGSEGDMMRSLEKIKQKVAPSTRVFPGHGECGFLLEQNNLY